MKKNLFSTITISKENEKKDVKIYKIEGEKYGVEVETESASGTKTIKVENVTTNEEDINKLLETVLSSTYNFELLDELAYDYTEGKETIKWI